MKKQRLLFIFFSAVLHLCWSVALASAATISLPAAGQKKCYNSSGTEIACAGTGQDGETMAGIAWPSPRFVVSGDCVTDNLTGLIWTQNANLPNMGMSWQQALDYVASLNAGGGLCGYTDWRLPQILELESLVHAGYNSETCGASACSANSAWLNTQGFSNAQSYSYWSSSTNAYSTSVAWCVYMNYGYVNFFEKTFSLIVWPVRGGQNTASAQVWETGQTKCYNTSGTEIACTATGQDGEKRAGVAWPTPRFTDNGNGTITDNLTGLIWLKNANCFSAKTWQDALTAASGLANSQCGLSDGSKAGDWRLPNRKELLSIVDFSKYSPALPAGHPFTNAYSGRYWSSSTYDYYMINAWSVYMSSGDVDVYNRLNSFYVWPVRGGQSGAAQNNCVASVSLSLVVHIPIVTYSGSNYWVDLQYNSTTGQLTVAGSDKVSNSSSYNSCTASTLSSDFKLHIPVVMLSGVSYWLDLEWKGDAFVIAGGGPN